MLPPVRTISGASGSYQNSSSVSASAHLTGEPIFPGQAADAERDVNPNHAGKLNVLLLSGRDVVAEDLSMLADALGRVIDLPREPGETSAVYVHRLAEALAGLSGAARAEAERQLNMMLRAIRLDFVIKAFLNPTGPEAARIVALLEMAGLREVDLATRTVLTSYRQNGGADVAPELPMQGPPQANGMPPAAAAAASVPSASPSAPSPVPAAPFAESASAAPATVSAPGPEPSHPSGMPIILAEEFDEEPELVSFHAETDNIFSRTSPSPAPERTESSSAASGAFAALEERRAAQPRAAALPGRPEVAVDARRLQVILDRAFEAGDNADPVIQAKAAMELLANEEGPAPRPPAGDRPLPRPAEPLAKPFIDYTRPPPRPGPQSEVHTAILALRGWSEADPAALPLLPASLEAEAVLSAALTPHAGPEPDMPEGLYALRGRGIAANDDRHRSALAAAEQQLLRTADEAAGLAADRRLDTAPASTAQAPRAGTDALIATALQLGHDPRLGAGYAPVPYPLVDERDEDRSDRAGYRSQSGGDDAEDGAGEQTEQHADHRSAEEAEGEAAALADGAEEGAAGSDPAFDLYQRMAGWS